MHGSPNLWTLDESGWPVDEEGYQIDGYIDFSDPQSLNFVKGKGGKAKGKGTSCYNLLSAWSLLPRMH